MYKLLIIIIIIFILLMANTYDHFDPAPTIKSKRIKPEIVLQLYQMLYDIHVLLKKYNVPYWLDGGTMLGAIRHKGIIPWDDDVDIQIDHNDEKIITSEEFIKDLDIKGYKIVKMWFGHKIFPKNGEKIKNYDWLYPGLDIFVMAAKNDIYTYKYPKAQENFSKCILKLKDVYPLKLYKFGELNVYGPNNPYPYLDSCYGTDWNEIGYVQYDHLEEQSTQKIKTVLTEEDRQPAKPTGPIKK